MFRYSRIAWFLLLTFAISWGCWGVVLLRGGDYMDFPSLPFFILASFGPAIAALVMRLCFRSEPPPRIAGARRSRWGLPIALALGASSGVLAAVIAACSGQPTVDLHAGWASAHDYFGSPVLFFVVMLAMGPVSEEPGWRGYLYPLLRQRAGPLRVGLAFGPIWALWHLPLFLIGGTYQHSLGIVSLGGLAFLISTTALTVLVSFAYERLAGLAGAIAVHFASNTVPTLLGLTALSSVVFDAAAKVLLAVAVLYLWKIREPVRR